MRKTVLFTFMCNLLLAVGWTVASAQETPATSPAAQRIGLQLVDNKSVYNIADEVNNYENILGFYQLNQDYPFTAGMLNDGDNNVIIYRQSDKDDEFAPVVRMNLQANRSVPEAAYIAALGFTSAPSQETVITADMLPEGWGTTTNGLVWQTNGSAYIAAQGGLTYTVPDGYTNATLQLIVYVGANVRGAYFTTNLNGEGWYISSEVSTGEGYIIRSFSNVNSGDVISIYGGLRENGTGYLSQSPDITQIAFRYFPNSYIPLMEVTPTVSHMGDEGWSNESPLDGQARTYTVNDLLDLAALQVSDIFSESTAANEHPEHYSYKADLDANIAIPSSATAGMDYYASADFTAATSASPTTAAFVGQNNWNFYDTNVYSPSAGQCAYMTFYGRIVYTMPITFMGNSVNVTMTSSTGTDGAGDMYVNDVLHTFAAGETYTWTIPVTAGGAIEFRGVSTTFSIDFIRIVISSGNGTPSGAPRHDSTEPMSRLVKGIDGKNVMLQNMSDSKTEPNSMIIIND